MHCRSHRPVSAPGRAHVLRLAAGLLAAALLAGCAPKLPEAVKSPYQQALEAYYRHLDSPTLGQALLEVDVVLDDNPGDLEARTLRAQILLQQYRVEREDGKRLQLFAELRKLARALNAGGQAQDWVRPRLYVTVGDLLLLDGYQLLRAMEADQGNMDFTFWKAYTHFVGAYQYFAYASSLGSAADSASRGLQRERNNADDGLIRALAGIVESTSLLDPAQEWPAIQARRRAALEELELRMAGQRPPLDVPNRSMLRLEDAEQGIAAGLQRLRSTEARRALAAACNDPAAEPGPDALWEQAGNALLRSAFHYRLVELLTGRPEAGYEQSIQLMNAVWKREGACP